MVRRTGVDGHAYGLTVNASIPVGIAGGGRLSGLTSGQLDSALDDIVNVGATWVREDMDWGAIQPTNSSTFSWTAWDSIVSKCATRNLTLLPILTYTPAWARPGGSGGTFSTPPASNSTFATFCAAAQTRYSGIRFWEIWNEANITLFWGGGSASTSAYTSLLAAASTAIKGVNASATVISCGTAPTDTSGGNISPTDWLDGILTAGANSSADGFGHHPYSFPVPPGYNTDAPWNSYQQIKWTTPSLASVMAAHGVTGKRIWLTEYGAPTNGPGALATIANGYNLANNPDHVDNTLQAQMATDFVTLSRQNADTIALACWYTRDDTGTDASNTENWYGLRNFAGTAKPSYAALQTAIATT